MITSSSGLPDDMALLMPIFLHNFEPMSGIQPFLDHLKTELVWYTDSFDLQLNWFSNAPFGKRAQKGRLLRVECTFKEHSHERFSTLKKVLE